MPSPYGSSIASLIVLTFAWGSSAFVTPIKRHILLSMSPSLTMSSENINNENGDEPIAGSFFNIVPPSSDTEKNSSTAKEASSLEETDMFKEIIQKTKLSRKQSGQGFAKTTTTSEHVSISNIKTTSTDDMGKQQSFVGIGKPLNDIQNPEYDEKGYTLYADETTGEKKRVFEALVEYPSIFKMKIVGQDDEQESFTTEIVEVVAESCGVECSMIEHSKRQNGKWTSVTVHAPVESADMLYALYENVDKNPRVKFKF